ncbi:MAG: Holliday junction branch migration protein RuvA [Candidatus Scatosoma sp.]
MIAYLRGRVLEITAETVILEVNGVGYEIYCSARVFSLARRGGELEVYTSLQVKEDGIVLYGFASAKEKDLFLKLTSVSGVGPKSGVAVLSAMSADEAATAILTADVKRLSAVKGLGKKTAEKIVLELHGKISAAEVMSASGDFSGDFSLPAASAEGLSSADEDAVSALQNLGFTRSESVRAVERAKKSGAQGLEEIIRRALQG